MEGALRIPTDASSKGQGQALHSSTWWEGKKQQKQDETGEYQTGCKEKHFCPRTVS